jgi:hypothetical protein
MLALDNHGPRDATVMASLLQAMCLRGTVTQTSAHICR